MCEHVFVVVRTTDDQVYVLDQLNALTNSLNRELLRAFVQYDRAESWKEDGATSMADWVAYRYGYTYSKAKQLVDVARALEDLPAIALAYSEGRLSWQIVVELCSFVSPDDDVGYASSAQRHTAAEVKMWARHARRMLREKAEIELAERAMWMRSDETVGTFRFGGRLPAAEGAMVKAAIESAAERFGPDDSGLYDPFETRCADAFIEIVGDRIASSTDTDRATVVVHTDVRSLNRIHGTGELDDGNVIASEVVRRLACDGRMQLVAKNDLGKPVGIGRRSRSVPAAMYRLLRKRDQGCAFNGCRRTRGLQAHHVVHWAHGGPTDLENLVLLCRYHHRMVHEGGYRLIQDSSSRLRVVRPDGRAVKTRPMSLRPDIAERMLGPARARAPAMTA